MFVCVCLSLKDRDSALLCACALQQTGRGTPKAFFLMLGFLNVMIDTHSSVQSVETAMSQGLGLGVWSVRCAEPVYSGYIFTSIYIFLSVKVFTPWKKEWALCWAPAGELEGGQGPAPTHKSLLFVTHAIEVPNTIQQHVSFSLIGRVREDATGTYIETYFSISAFNTIWLKPVAVSCLSQTCVGSKPFGGSYRAHPFVFPPGKQGAHMPSN